MLEIGIVNSFFWMLNINVKQYNVKLLKHATSQYLFCPGVWYAVHRKHMYILISRLELYFSPVFFLLLDKKASHFVERQIKTFVQTKIATVMRMFYN